MQVAQAKASKAHKARKARKAKRAYRELMATKGWKWGPVVFEPRKQSDYYFATPDINGDGVPELIDFGSSLARATNTVRVYVYSGGKVKKAGSLYRNRPRKLYAKGHVLFHRALSAGG